jgi:hypothetical protein
VNFDSFRLKAAGRKSAAMIQAVKDRFHPAGEFLTFSEWASALDVGEGVDLLFVDMIATLHEPGKIAGYEQFALAKMNHAVAAETPLVLIAPEPEYELDFMSGWPNFVFGHIRRPVNMKIFRRASTWV